MSKVKKWICFFFFFGFLTANAVIVSEASHANDFWDEGFHYSINEDESVTIESPYAPNGFLDGIIEIPEYVDNKRVTHIREGAFDAPVGVLSFEVAPDHPFYSQIDGVLFDKTQKTLLCYPNLRTEPDYQIPEGVTSIGAHAFYLCRLNTVEIPESVTSIDSSAFLNALFLESVHVDPNNERYEQIDGVLFDKISKTLLRYPNKKDGTSYAIPEGIISINDYAFSYANLTRLEIPDTVTSIDRYSFDKCDSLTAIEIPDSVTSISTIAFNPETTLIVSPGSYACKWIQQLYC